MDLNACRGFSRDLQAIQDRDGAKQLLAAFFSQKTRRRVKHIWADGGYVGALLNWSRRVWHRTIEIVKRSDLHVFKVLPRRWVVERTFGWFGRFHVLHREVFDLPNEHAQMTAHRTQHPQRELRLTFEQCENAFLLHEQNLGVFQRAGVGGITGRRGQRHLGKRIAGPKNVDHLLLAGGSHAMNIHRPTLHDVKTMRRISG